MMGVKKQKLLILGWDAADWQVMDQLIAHGKMPALKRVLNRGVRGTLETMDPPISPMLWTSIATGVTPDKHGILGFAEASPEGNGIRPLMSTSRKVKAFWNMFNQYGYKCNVVGWWPSHPAEPINGAIVSNFYQMANSPDPAKWKMAPGTVHPENIAEILAQFRVHPAEITPAMVLPFVPEIYQIPEEESKVITTLRNEIAKAASLQAASTWLMQNTEWDVMGVYFDMIDHLSHMAMKFRAPKLEGVPDEKFRFYNQVVDGAYRFQDMMLDRMLDLTDDNTAILILSDHGFESGNLRPRVIPVEPAGPTSEHSPYGMIAFSGPGIHSNTEIFGSSVIDIAPTILHYMGLPVGKDMYGKVLQQCFSEHNEIQWIDSWENHSDGGCSSGMHPEELRVNTWDSREALEQLIELGYIERPEGTDEEIVAKTKAEVEYYLAQSLSFQKRDEEAVRILEKIIPLYPDFHRYRSLIIQCYIRLRKWKEAEMHTDALFGINTVLDLKVWFFRGKMAQAQYRPKKALFSYEKALEIAPSSIDIRLQKGNILLSMGQYHEAEKVFSEIANEDPRNAEAHFGRGMASLRLGEADTAIDFFMDTLELKPRFAAAHFQLGECFRLCEDYQPAETAYLNALHIHPGMFRARNRLMELYTSRIPDTGKLKEQVEWLAKFQKFTIKCISGLPAAGQEDICTYLKSKGIECIDLRPSVDFPELKADLNLKSINQNPDAIFLLTQAQLMKIPDDRPLKLIWLDSDDSLLFPAQLKRAGQESKIVNKVYPTHLATLNSEQRRVFGEWSSVRPLLEIVHSDWLSEKEAVESQVSGLFELSDNP
ncbi:MAG: alkaline phosphatase family protein [Flavobacteriales bacterium]